MNDRSGIESIASSMMLLIDAMSTPSALRVFSTFATNDPWGALSKLNVLSLIPSKGVCPKNSNPTSPFGSSARSLSSYAFMLSFALLRNLAVA